MQRTADIDHLLRDIFDAAVNLIQRDREQHTPDQIRDALSRASLRTLRLESERRQEIVERNWDNLFEMLSEWDQTRKMVRTRWASVLPKDAAWKAPAPEEPKLAFTVDSRGTVQMHVGSEMIGLVSSLHLKASADQARPEITVSFLQDLPPESVSKLSVEAQEHLSKSAKLLNKFPFVQVKLPGGSR